MFSDGQVEMLRNNWSFEQKEGEKIRKTFYFLLPEVIETTAS